MLSRMTKKYKVISSQDAFDFEVKLNSFCESLSAKGIEYDVQTNPTAGLLAFIVYKIRVDTPEDTKDEYEMAGERYVCIQCPFYVRPTDGRRKNTRCPLHNCLVNRNTACCDEFYQKLDKGEIKIVEVDV